MKGTALCLSLFCLFGFLAAQEGNLMVSKDFVEDYIVQGRNLTISYTFHNIGDGEALNIDIHDESYPEDRFELIQGSFTGHVDLVPSRQNRTLTVVVVPNFVGEHKDLPAVLTYQRAANQEAITAYSSSSGNILALSENEYQNYHAVHTKEWIVFLILSLIPVGVPFLMYLQKQNDLKKNN